MNRSFNKIRKGFSDNNKWIKFNRIITNFYTEWVNYTIPKEYEVMFEGNKVCDILKSKGFITRFSMQDDLVPIVLWLRTFLNNYDYVDKWPRVHNKRMISLYKAAMNPIIKKSLLTYDMALCLYDNSRTYMEPLPLHNCLYYYIRDREKSSTNMDHLHRMSCDDYLTYCISSFYATAFNLRPMLRLVIFPDQGFSEPDFKEMFGMFKLSYIQEIRKKYGYDD